MIKSEKSLILCTILLGVAYLLEHYLLKTSMGQLAGIFVIIGAIMLGSASVVHHAEHLALKFGEPLGTIILTLSAVTIEVILISVMMQSGNSPTLARDTIYSAIMLDIAGILGLSALVGGWKFGIQSYNINSTTTYIGLMISALILGMVVPIFIQSHNQNLYAMFTIAAMIAMYLVFLKLQTGLHRAFFEFKEDIGSLDSQDKHLLGWKKSTLVLFLAIVLIALAAEMLSTFMTPISQKMGLPVSFIGLMVAVISASPELVTALRASLKNNLQTSVNIAFGASLATVLLTVPIIEFVSLVTGVEFKMGLDPIQSSMLLGLILVSMVTTGDGETNTLEGMVHLALFGAFVMLTFLA